MTRVKNGRTRQQNALVQPFLKWAGGKRQLLPAIRPLVPKFKRYYEPFIGGGAVFFDLMPPNAIINDVNADLINCYVMIRDCPEQLLESVERHRDNNSSEYFYQIREQDRHPKFTMLASVERASRLLYLNKTCFNGLFRVNSQGQFNVPFGDYKNPIIADPAVIRAVSHYLNRTEVSFRNEDFSEVVRDAKQGDFVYFDPPYDPVSDTASFTGYNLNGFDRDEQRRLKMTCDELTRRGVQVLISNSGTTFIRELYAEEHYHIRAVQARRSINVDPTGRGKIDELLISNYPVPEEVSLPFG